VDPYYDRAQRVCQVLPASFEVTDWEDPRLRPRLPLAGDDVQTIIYKFAHRDPFVRDYPAEVCGAKNISVYEHATVLEVQTNPGANCVTRLRVAAAPGREFAVRAKLFVLAAGGIEIPRLLLLSNAEQSTGLGNQHDLVGRYFMEHPHFWSGMFAPTSPQVFEQAALYNDIHMVNGVPIVGKLALTERALRRQRLLNHNVQLVRRMVPGWNEPSTALNSLRALGSAVLGRTRLDNVSEHFGNVAGGMKEIVVGGARRIRERLVGLPERPVYRFANMMEQIPNSESRVKLGPHRDLFGQNLVQLDWKITPEEMRSAMRTQDLIGTSLERAGLGRFYVELEEDRLPENFEGGYHHMGTTRMHTDPKRGVVDADCRVHGTHNLFIAGPSVFPTGGYANPVLTLVALALRLADHIGMML
jgi:choline dehydrogenase-like flavoprotein